MDPLSNQLVASAMNVWLLQKLKRARWFPWVHQQSDRAQRAAAVLVALLSTAGIHITFESDGGVLTVTGLTLANAGRFLWEALKTFVFQEFIYRAGVKP